EQDSELNGKMVPAHSQSLNVVSATLEPAVDENQFRLPAIPDSLPRFSISADNQLIDGPMMPARLTADPTTTFESIMARLVTEEARYDNLEYHVTETQMNKNSAGAHYSEVLQSNTETRSVCSNGFSAFQISEKSFFGNGNTQVSTRRGSH